MNNILYEIVVWAGLLMIGYYTGMIITAMHDWYHEIRRWIAVAVIGIVVAIGLHYLFDASFAQDKQLYNSGICTECNGKYILTAKSGHWFYWTCKDCGNTIEVMTDFCQW